MYSSLVVEILTDKSRQDGGGVRGYTSLLILKEIFKAVENEAGRKVKPCELFDLIGGTSTGG
jgi:patatin-like phospholipase/acyl hydrolase